MSSGSAREHAALPLPRNLGITNHQRLYSVFDGTKCTKSWSGDVWYVSSMPSRSKQTDIAYVRTWIAADFCKRLGQIWSLLTAVAPCGHALRRLTRCLSQAWHHIRTTSGGSRFRGFAGGRWLSATGRN